MTFQEKVHFLKSYARLKDNLDAYQEQIVNLELNMLPKGLHISDMPRRGGSDDPLGDFGARIWEIDRRIKRTEQKMLQVIATVNQLERTDPKGHKLLTMQYISCKPVKEVEIVMAMSPNTRRKYHNRAVEELQI